MLIPSIDLKSGKVVQLVQGERLAIESADIFAWVDRFARFPKVQVIDLDAAMGSGTNAPIVAKICGRLPCRVGGGVRSADRAQQLFDAGAKHVILGSSLFVDGQPNVKLAAALADRFGTDRLIAAVDSRGGFVVIDGWRTALPITAVEAIKALEPYFGEFLYTHVDTEGLMRGTDMDAVRRVRNATTRRITAAGGISTEETIDELDRLGVDSVVGMALYTGLLKLPE